MFSTASLTKVFILFLVLDLMQHRAGYQQNGCDICSTNLKVIHIIEVCKGVSTEILPCHKCAASYKGYGIRFTKQINGTKFGRLDKHKFDSGRYLIRQDGVLFVTNIQDSDIGKYRYSYRNLTLNKKCCVILRYKNSCPKIIVASSGSTVNLTCNVGDPIPKDSDVIWSKHGDTIAKNGKVNELAGRKFGGRLTATLGTLMISNVSQEDSGKYLCRIRSINPRHHKFHLYIKSLSSTTTTMKETISEISHKMNTSLPTKFSVVTRRKENPMPLTTMPMTKETVQRQNTESSSSVSSVGITSGSTVMNKEGETLFTTIRPNTMSTLLVKRSSDVSIATTVSSVSETKPKVQVNIQASKSLGMRVTSEFPISIYFLIQSYVLMMIFKHY